MKQSHPLAITAILLLACLVAAALAQSTPQTPEGENKEPEEYLKLCREAEEKVVQLSEWILVVMLS